MLKTNKQDINLKQTRSLYDLKESNTFVDTLLRSMIQGRIQSLESDKVKLELEKSGIKQKLHDKEKRIEELGKSNQEMKTELKSLPYGRTLEQIRSDYESHQHLKKEMMRLLIELKNAGCLSFIKRRRIIRALIDYL